MALQVRIEAIRTVKKLAHVGGHEMVLQMVAWQDPQAIAIKAFYEPDLHVNFCAKLATDPVVQVVPCALCRAHAVKCAANLCCMLLTYLWPIDPPGSCCAIVDRVATHVVYL